MEEPYRAPAADEAAPGARPARSLGDLGALALCGVIVAFATLSNVGIWLLHFSARLPEPALSTMFEGRVTLIPGCILAFALTRWLTRSRRRPAHWVDKGYLALAILSGVCLAIGAFPAPVAAAH